MFCCLWLRCTLHFQVDAYYSNNTGICPGHFVTIAYLPFPSQTIDFYNVARKIKSIITVKLKGVEIGHLCSRFFSCLYIDLPITVLFSQSEMLTCAAFISGSLPRFLKWFVVIWDLPPFLSLVPGRKSGPNRKCLAIYRLSRCYVSGGYIEEAAHSLFTLLLDHLPLSLIFLPWTCCWDFLSDFFFTVASYWSLGSCLAPSFDAWLGVLVTEHLVWCGWVGLGMLSIGSRAWAEAGGPDACLYLTCYRRKMQLEQLLVTSNCNLLLGTRDGFTFSVIHLNFSVALIIVILAHIFEFSQTFTAL